MRYVQAEIAKTNCEFYLVDSSSLIDMINIGVDVSGKLLTTIQMREEIYNHAARGKLPDYAANVVRQIQGISASDHMRIKEDVILASEKACSEKKRTRDPISQADINFAVEAIKQARAGYRVGVLSEDEHIYATLRFLLQTDKYKSFAPQLEVLRVRELSEKA